MRNKTEHDTRKKQTLNWTIVQISWFAFEVFEVYDVIGVWLGRHAAELDAEAVCVAVAVQTRIGDFPIFTRGPAILAETRVLTLQLVYLALTVINMGEILKNTLFF